MQLDDLMGILGIKNKDVTKCEHFWIPVEKGFECRECGYVLNRKEK